MLNSLAGNPHLSNHVKFVLVHSRTKVLHISYVHLPSPGRHLLKVKLPDRTAQLSIPGNFYRGYCREVLDLGFLSRV